MSILEPIPKKSSGAIKAILGLDVPNARDITEMQAPQTQGKIARKIAENVQNNYSSYTEEHQIASDFIELYDSGVCYICNCPIEHAPEVENLEHKLPIVEALSFEMIIQFNSKELKKMGVTSNINDIGYLLEYARSHSCCNKLKNVTSFVEFILDQKTGYLINENNIKNLLEEIWDETVGTKPTRYRDEATCGNAVLHECLRRNYDNKKNFVNENIERIINIHVNPILTYINEKMKIWGQGSMAFAQLIQISNLAFNVDQKIWNQFGVYEVIHKDTLFYRLYEQALKVNYDSDLLFKAINSVDYFTKKNFALIDFLGRISKRSIESKIDEIIKTKVGKIYRDYVRIFLDEYFHNRLIGGITLDFTKIGNCVFGYDYIYRLIDIQTTTMYDDIFNTFFTMMINVNNFCIVYLYIFIIEYDIYKLNKEWILETVIRNGVSMQYIQIHDNCVNDLNHKGIQFNSEIYSLIDYLYFLLNDYSSIFEAKPLLMLANSQVGEQTDFDTYADENRSARIKIEEEILELKKIDVASQMLELKKYILEKDVENYSVADTMLELNQPERFKDSKGGRGKKMTRNRKRKTNKKSKRQKRSKIQKKYVT